MSDLASACGFLVPGQLAQLLGVREQLIAATSCYKGRLRD